MELRWHRFREVVTGAQVREFVDRHGCSMSDALRELRDESPWVLQFRHSPYDTWTAVPHISEPRPTNT